MSKKQTSISVWAILWLSGVNKTRPEGRQALRAQRNENWVRRSSLPNPAASEDTCLRLSCGKEGFSYRLKGPVGNRCQWVTTAFTPKKRKQPKNPEVTLRLALAALLREKGQRRETFFWAGSCLPKRGWRLWAFQARQAQRDRKGTFALSWERGSPFRNTHLLHKRWRLSAANFTCKQWWSKWSVGCFQVISLWVNSKYRQQPAVLNELYSICKTTWAPHTAAQLSAGHIHRVKLCWRDLTHFLHQTCKKMGQG